MAAAAVLTGARSIAAIAEWAADAPQPVRGALGARRDAPDRNWPPFGDPCPPSMPAVVTSLQDLPERLGGRQPAAGLPHHLLVALSLVEQAKR